MKFIAVNLRDYHNNKWSEAMVNCRVLTLEAKSMERAKEFLRRYHKDSAWFLARADRTQNIAYMPLKKEES